VAWLEKLAMLESQKSASHAQSAAPTHAAPAVLASAQRNYSVFNSYKRLLDKG